MSRGFHSENELYSMQNSITVGHFDHWNHISYDCSYPQFAVIPRIAERSKDGETDICDGRR